MTDISDPGKLQWLISCDESGMNGTRYYGFGSLWMKYQRRGDFARDFQALRDKHGFTYECKWSRVTRKSLPFMKDVVEYFFMRHWLAFHCIIVRKGVVNKAFHRSDYDLARRKHLTMLLTNKIKRCLEARPDREQTFRIYVDPIASRYAKADEAVEVIANNVLSQSFAEKRPVDSVITRNSKDTPQIQLCDLLLGAVMESWQQDANRSEKIELQSCIASHIGWENLNAGTYPGERKFNIWYFYDPTMGDREHETRETKLIFPITNML